MNLDDSALQQAEGRPIEEKASQRVTTESDREPKRGNKGLLW